MNSANVARLHSSDISRTLFIDDLGVEATDFNAPEDVIEQLIESGRAGAVEFLDGARRA